MRKHIFWALILVLAVGFIFSYATTPNSASLDRQQSERVNLKFSGQRDYNELTTKYVDEIADASLMLFGPSISRPANESAVNVNVEKESFYGSKEVESDINLDVQETGDDCTDPIIIGSLPYTDNTHSLENFVHDFGQSGPDAVYEFTITECSDVVISLCNTSPNTLDTYLWLWDSPSACGLTAYAIAADDDQCTTPAWGTSEISIRLNCGVYYAGVDAYVSTGAYQLDITATPCGEPAPANDDCADAQDVGSTFPVTVCGTTLGATTDCAGVLDWCGVWYSFNAPNAFNDVTISFCETTTDLPTAGIVVMNDCACDDYVLADAAAFVTCDNATENVEMSWYGLPGPATYYYPVTTGYMATDFCFEINVQEQCQITCPPGSIPEDEPVCYDYYVDHYNSGCNEDSLHTPQFTTIADGDTICGTAGHHLTIDGDSGDTISARDTDWYRFDMGTTFAEFQFYGIANFPLQLLIIDAMDETCTSTPILDFSQVNPCDTAMTSVVGSGVFYLWAGPQNTIDVDCATGEYYVWVHVVPPPQNDATPLWVDSPAHHRMPAGSTQPVIASVTNFGEGSYTFDVNATITGSVTGEVFNQTVTASNVDQTDTVQVNFGNFTPICVEDFTMVVTTLGVGDENPANDVLNYMFAPHAFGYDGYTDGSGYWVYPFNDGDRYACRFPVAAGSSADLESGLVYFYSFGAEEAYATPFIAPSDANDNPDMANVVWTGAPTYFGPAVGTYPLEFDLTSVADQTSDFWFGFTISPGSLPDLGGVRGEGQFATEDYPDNNRVFYAGQWYLLDDVWANPTDVYVWCSYDITGGAYADGVPYSIDSPGPAVIGSGPHEVLVTFLNNGLADISGASAEVTITGPGGVDFNATQPVNVLAGETGQVDFGDWTASGTGPTNYDIEVVFTYGSDMDNCNDVLLGASYVMAGTVVSQENFESGNGGFTEVVHEGPAIWQYGEDATAGYSSATNVWGTVLNADYPIDGCASLRSPTITLPSTGGAMALQIWYQLEAPGDPWDYCNVKISVDGGANFDVLQPYGGYPYHDTYLNNLCSNNTLQDGYSGHTAGWKIAGFDFSAYAGEDAIFSFDFASDHYVVEYGFYLDDFTIIEYPQTCLQYLPGDANMAVGQWPPQVIGGDVTYLVNYFRGLPANPACLVGGFYCSGDANGDCLVIGSDVTRLVTYFRGLVTIIPCADYEPCWQAPPNQPSEWPPMPSGWPNCE